MKSPSSSSPESQLGLGMQYKIAFQAWQSQVTSYWQQTNYFVAFQSVVLVGDWKILGHRSAVALCVAGILLVLIWYTNNLKVHSDIRYWWATMSDIERIDSTSFPLVRRYEFGTEGFRFVRYLTITNLIPLLFLCAWLWMLTTSIRALAPKGVQHRSTLTQKVSPEKQSADMRSPKQEMNSSNEPQDSATSKSPSHPFSVSPASQSPEGKSKGYTNLSVPNNLFGAGIAFAVDSEGNRYVVSDLIQEAGLKTYSTEPPYSSFSASISTGEIEEAINQNRWGDLVSRVLFVVSGSAKKRGTVSADVELKVVDVVAKKTDLVNAWQAIRETRFWRQRREGFPDMRLFLVAETISSKRVILNFPNTDPQVLNQAFAELSEMGSDTFVRRSPTSIDIISRLPLILACKAVELDAKSLSENRLGAELVPAILGRPGRGHPSTAELKEVSVPASAVLATVPLPSTHYADGPPQLVSFARNATYGAILDDLKRKILAAGINEVRIYDSGLGFALATRFEVTDQHGIPLPGEARFLPRRADGKKLRGYYITVAARPTPTAYVSTNRPQDLFSMKYGLTSLPNDMEQIQIEPGTSVRIFVLEFENKSGINREVSNQECAVSALAHMAQSGLVKR